MIFPPWNCEAGDVGDFHPRIRRWRGAYVRRGVRRSSLAGCMCAVLGIVMFLRESEGEGQGERGRGRGRLRVSVVWVGLGATIVADRSGDNMFPTTKCSQLHIFPPP